MYGSLTFNRHNWFDDHGRTRKRAVGPPAKGKAYIFLPVDAKQVGVRLGCSWRTVLRLADRGAMPRGLKLGALRRWDADQLFSDQGLTLAEAYDRAPGIRNVMLDELFMIFDALDAKEYSSEYQGQDQENCNELLLAHLRSPNGHRHGQAAADQDDRVDRAQRQIDGAARLAENVGIRRPVERVGHEHAAEEQNFGDQEYPHP